MRTHRPWKVRAFFWGFALGAGGYITIMGLALFVQDDAVLEGVLLLSKPITLLVPLRKHDAFRVFLLLFLLVPYWGLIAGSVTLAFAYAKRRIQRARCVPRGKCANCAYDLRGLPSNKCPECGTAFDEPVEMNVPDEG